MTPQPAGKEWERLLAHIRRAADFTLLIAILPSLQHSQETARILSSLFAETSRPLRILEPSTAEELPAATAKTYTVEGNDRPQTLWLQLIPDGDAPDLADWPAALAHVASTLNKARGTLIQNDTHTLILVGTHELLDILQTHAPDLWSIRRYVAFIDFDETEDTIQAQVSRIDAQLSGIQAQVSETVRATSDIVPPSAVEADAAKALAAADALRDQPGTDLDQLRYLIRAAKTLEARGRQTRVNEILDRALLILKNADLPESPELAIQLNNLAQRLSNVARFSDAEPIMRRALAIDEQSYGPHHPDVAKLTINLAALLYATNRLAEAELLFRRALAINEQSYGPNHPSVATALNSLAGLLNATNRSAEAEPLFRRALAIGEQSYGPHHPTVAIRLNNLAELLRATNRLAEAEPLCRRALAIDEQSYGPTHPSVAIRLNNLAALLYATNRLAEAEPLYRRVVEIFEQSYGDQHPNVATALNNLAELLRATNRLAEAEPLYRRALAIDEQSYGPHHPGVAIDLNNLAELLRATDRWEKAEPLFRRMLLIFLQSFGGVPGVHKHVRLGVGNYAVACREQGLAPDVWMPRLIEIFQQAGVSEEKMKEILDASLGKS